MPRNPTDPSQADVLFREVNFGSGVNTEQQWSGNKTCSKILFALSLKIDETEYGYSKSDILVQCAEGTTKTKEIKSENEK